MTLRALVLSLLLVGSPAAAVGQVLLDPTGEAETITVSTSAIGITATICDTSDGRRTAALLQVLTNSIFFTLHDSGATPASGDHEATSGDFYKLSSSDVQLLRMVRDGGSDATVKITCYHSVRP